VLFQKVADPTNLLSIWRAVSPSYVDYRVTLRNCLTGNQCDINSVLGHERALSDVIVCLMEDGAQVTMMSTNSRRLFSEKFDADKVYGGKDGVFTRIIAACFAQSHFQEEG